MKKNILLSTLATVLGLSLAGCGSTGSPEDSIGATGPVAPVIAESLAPTECPETEVEPTRDSAVFPSQEAVCDLGSVQFSLSLSENWDYEIRYLTFEGVITTYAIVFWDIDYPEDTFTLVYAPMSGICGTGVTIEEITLPYSNLSGWKYTEILQNGEKYWINITLSNPDVPLQGNTLQLQATLPLEDWDILAPDFDRIVETIQLEHTGSEEPATHDILILPEETPSATQSKLPLSEETPSATQG